VVSNKKSRFKNCSNVTSIYSVKRPTLTSVAFGMRKKVVNMIKSFKINHKNEKNIQRCLGKFQKTSSIISLIPSNDRLQKQNENCDAIMNYRNKFSNYSENTKFTKDTMSHSTNSSSFCSSVDQNSTSIPSTISSTSRNGMTVQHSSNRDACMLSFDFIDGLCKLCMNFANRLHQDIVHDIERDQKLKKWDVRKVIN